MRLLLFSADDSFRFLVRQTFRKLNVRDVLSSSVAADTAQFMTQAPDIGLVDLETDAESGLACLDRIRKADPEMPVLVVSRSDDRKALHPAQVMGIEGVLPKRISGHELSHRVSQTLKTPKRMPVPEAAKPRPAVVLAKPAPTLAVPEPARAESTALKQELAALTERLGHSPVIAPRPSPGGSAAQVTGTVSGGKLDIGAGQPSASKRSASLGDDDFPPPAPTAKPSGGKLDFDDFETPAQQKASGKFEDPDADRQRKKADEAKRRWKEMLEESGHQTRTGKDVATLNVDGIVAEHLEWLESKGAGGKRANFQGLDLAGADLAGKILANATFREVDMSDSHLVDSRLDGADFRYAVLGAANLAGAELGVAQLRHADLRLANLEGANLRGADLSGARLRGAKLAGADFSGVTLMSADLTEADLSQVENLRQAQVDKTICDMKTKLPPGLFRPRKDDP